MSISAKIKATDNKIEQNKAQYNLDRKTAKISTLVSGNISKYKLLTGKDVLPVKYLLEKAAAIKRFEYSPLVKGLKKQTSIKISTMLLNLVKRKKSKQKAKRSSLSHI